MLPSLLRTVAPRRLLLRPTPFLRPLTTGPPQRPSREIPTTLPSPSTPTLSHHVSPPPPEIPTTLPSPSNRPGPPDPALHYHVSRTPYIRLPVYALAKRGGSLKVTVIKKVDGDKQAFRRALMEELGLEADQVRIKVPTGHVEVRGKYAPEIRAWLARQGF